MSASRRRRPLQRPDLRLVQRRTGPDIVLDVVHLALPITPRGRAWLEAHAGARQWLGRALVIEPAICAPGSLLARASDAGLGIAGWGCVTGDMLEHLRAYGAPELTLKQLAARLGFTAQEWRLMEADERMVPDPDAFWHQAMRLVDELQDESERRANAAGYN